MKSGKLMDIRGVMEMFDIKVGRAYKLCESGVIKPLDIIGHRKLFCRESVIRDATKIRAVIEGGSYHNRMPMKKVSDLVLEASKIMALWKSGKYDSRSQLARELSVAIWYIYRADAIMHLSKDRRSEIVTGVHDGKLSQTVLIKEANAARRAARAAAKKELVGLGVVRAPLHGVPVSLVLCDALALMKKIPFCKGAGTRDMAIELGVKAPELYAARTLSFLPTELRVEVLSGKHDGKMTKKEMMAKASSVQIVEQKASMLEYEESALSYNTLRMGRGKTYKKFLEPLLVRPPQRLIDKAGSPFPKVDLSRAQRPTDKSVWDQNLNSDKGLDDVELQRVIDWKRIVDDIKVVGDRIKSLESEVALMKKSVDALGHYRPGRNGWLTPVQHSGPDITKHREVIRKASKKFGLFSDLQKDNNGNQEVE